MIQTASKHSLRHEQKYLLLPGVYRELHGLVKKVMQLDAHGEERGGYHVRSLYFDDLFDTALYEKAGGNPLRRKFRLRVYDFSDRVIKLEIKNKIQEYIQKQATTVSRAEVERMLNGDITFLYDRSIEGSVANSAGVAIRGEYYRQFRANALQPKVIVDYYREAFVLPFNQIRITFDKALAVAKRNGDIFDPRLSNYNVGSEYAVIMEVKYNNFLPTHLQSLLQGYCANRLAISKYYICRIWQDRFLGEG